MTKQPSPVRTTPITHPKTQHNGIQLETATCTVRLYNAEQSEWSAHPVEIEGVPANVVELVHMVEIISSSAERGWRLANKLSAVDELLERYRAAQQ